jgi:hypothetical protein
MSIDFIIPKNPKFCFKDLLIECSEIFEISNPNDYIITDEVYNIYPFHISLLDFIKSSKKK